MYKVSNNKERIYLAIVKEHGISMIGRQKPFTNIGCENENNKNISCMDEAEVLIIIIIVRRTVFTSNDF